MIDETQEQTPPQDMPPALESTLTDAQESLPKPWGLRDFFLFIAFVPVGLFAANILVLLGYALLRPTLHWHLAKQQLSTDPFFLLALQTVFYGLMLALFFFSWPWTTGSHFGQRFGGDVSQSGKHSVALPAEHS